MIEQFLRVAVAGVQAARSGLAACVFKSKPTKKLCRKGLSVALLGVSALSLSHMASATLITVEADVLANTGSSVTFAQFDQSLGTLTGAQLTYSFGVTYWLFNDGSQVDANEWSSNSSVWVTGAGASTDLRAHTQEIRDAIAEGIGPSSVLLSGTVGLTLSELYGGTGASVLVGWNNPTVRGNTLFIGPGGVDNNDLYSRDPYMTNLVATASLGYVYDAAADSGTRAADVPAPPTLALFTLGLMGIAARRVKARKYR